MSRKAKKAAAEAAAEKQKQAADDLAADRAPADAAAEPDPRPPAEEAADATPEATDEAADEVAALQARLAEQQDRLLRTAAELDNLRKRSRREVHDARRFARADALRPLLEVLDNFERALRHAEGGAAAEAEPAAGDGAAAPDAFRRGVELIAQSFRQALQDCGVRRIEALGRPFDPTLHEAVGQAPAPDETTGSGTILAELQAGYTLEDLVLRASRVIVAQ